ncbi:sulfite exporter TauE/SafE family protein [Methanothermococcus sp. Ax23]|uniref:sulfite exporter TauE/SafE family protein n=1 Tax=Methanothermococcus sp. Ax23 TaxID=3156486 RepID=UPI003B9F3D0A
MDLIIILSLVILGMFIGFISGLLGIGGGFILVPILIYLFDFMGVSDDISVKMAVGTSLFVIFLTSIAGAHKHSLNKNVIWKYSLILGLFGILGSIVGVKVVVDYLSGNLHKVLFGIFLILISLNIIYSNFKDKNNLDMINNIINTCHNINYKNVGIMGFLTGFLSSIFGIGGGIIVVPFLNIFLKFPIKSAIGTSLGMMTIISLTGLLGYMINPYPFDYNLYNIGYVSLFAGLIVAPIAMIFSKYGAKIAYKTKSEILRNILSIILMIVGIKMVI